MHYMLQFADDICQGNPIIGGTKEKLKCFEIFLKSPVKLSCVHLRSADQAGLVCSVEEL